MHYIATLHFPNRPTQHRLIDAGDSASEARAVQKLAFQTGYLGRGISGRVVKVGKGRWQVLRHDGNRLVKASPEISLEQPQEIVKLTSGYQRRRLLNRRTRMPAETNDSPHVAASGTLDDPISVAQKIIAARGTVAKRLDPAFALRQAILSRRFFTI